MPKQTTKSSKSPATVLGSQDAYNRSLIEASLDPLVTIGPDGKITDVNEGSVKVTGMSREKLIGTDFCDYFTEPDKAREGYQQAFTKSFVIDYPLTIRHKNGRLTDVLYNASVYKDARGNVLGVFAAARDVTERKKAELRSGETTVQLQRMSSELEIIIDAIPGLVFYKDVNNRFLRVNKYMADSYKKTKKQLEGASCFDLHPQKEAQAYFDDDLQVIRSRTPKLGIDERFETESGVSWISTSKIPYFDEKGEVVGVIGVSMNITERKQAEERIQQQTKEIMDLSTPVMQVWQGVVVAPLIGSLDSQRTQQFMERLLTRIVETNSPVALVDIMGVPTIDTQTAQHLIETISAVRLLGAQVVLTGVRPAIAQTLVHLGIDLSGIMTRASLAAGLQVALDILDLKVVRKNDSR
jgi:PAS domain S-box-containing protein